jgi:hypothetical protein
MYVLRAMSPWRSRDRASGVVTVSCTTPAVVAIFFEPNVTR